MKRQKKEARSIIRRPWSTKTYLVAGIILILVSLVTAILARTTIFNFNNVINPQYSLDPLTGMAIQDGFKIRWDFLLPLLGIISLFVMGILYSLIGMAKIKISRLSDISIKMTVLSTMLLVLLELMIFLAMALGFRADIWTIVLIEMVLVITEAVILISALVLLIVSIARK